MKIELCITFPNGHLESICLTVFRVCTVYPSMYIYTHIGKFQMDHDIGLTMLAYACRSVIIESYYCITYSIWIHVRKIVRIVCGVCFVINVCMSVSHLFHQSASRHQSPLLPPPLQYMPHITHSPVPVPRSPPRSIRELLLRNNLGQYYEMLINNGYDDLRFMHETTEAELETVGIASFQDREKARVLHVQ